MKKRTKFGILFLGSVMCVAGTHIFAEHYQFMRYVIYGVSSWIIVEAFAKE